MPTRLSAALGWCFRPGPRNGLCWALALGVAVAFLVESWGNPGYRWCDFGNQWLMGRMFARGEAHLLYLVGPQRTALADSYEGEDLAYVDETILLKDNPDEAVEGPLYPPIAGLVYWPFALLPPPASKAVLVLAYALLAFVCGRLLRAITVGKLRTGEAALFVLLFPVTSSAISMGQNSVLTLAVVLGGWALWGRGRPWAAGLVWGLLAYKPVFAVALLWVPLALLSWRMFLGMVLSVGGLCLATLPFCLPPEARTFLARSEDEQGWEWTFRKEQITAWFEQSWNPRHERWEWTPATPWYRWLEVGRNNADNYARSANWIWMSRDLVGLPRRELWDGEHFTNHVRYLLGWYEGDVDELQGVQRGEVTTPLGDADVTMLGWLLVGGVAGVTFLLSIGTALVRRGRGLPPWPRGDGPRAAFLLFGALLTVWHYMWYDVLPLALPAALVLVDAPRRGRLGRLFLGMLGLVLLGCSLDFIFWHFGWLRIPFETLALLALWAWAGLAGLTECPIPHDQ